MSKSRKNSFCCSTLIPQGSDWFLRVQFSEGVTHQYFRVKSVVYHPDKVIINEDDRQVIINLKRVAFIAWVNDSDSLPF